MTDATDETKRKFREALEHKKNTAQGTDHKDANAKVDHAHGPAGHKREFRRKSG